MSTRRIKGKKGNSKKNPQRALKAVPTVSSVEEMLASKAKQIQQVRQQVSLQLLETEQLKKKLQSQLDGLSGRQAEINDMLAMLNSPEPTPAPAKVAAVPDPKPESEPVEDKAKGKDDETDSPEGRPAVDSKAQG